MSNSVITLRKLPKAEKIQLAIFISLLIGAGIYIYYNEKKKREEKLKQI